MSHSDGMSACTSSDCKSDNGLESTSTRTSETGTRLTGMTESSCSSDCDVEGVDESGFQLRVMRSISGSRESRDCGAAIKSEMSAHITESSVATEKMNSVVRINSKLRHKVDSILSHELAIGAHRDGK